MQLRRGGRLTLSVTLDVLGCVSLKLMATDHILALLVSERDKLTSAIEVLAGTPAPEPIEPQKAARPTPPARRKMSAAGRKAIADAARKRWAALKASKATAAPPAAAPKVAPAQPPTQKKKASSAKDAAFRKKMSEQMKAAWATRKKRAASRAKSNR
jgi:hypothetical protein